MGMFTTFTWFSVRGGSVIPKALPIACISGFINFCLLYWNVVTEEDGGGLMQHPNVYMFFLSVVALVCAFHVNAAYQRYWEGRGALQRMDSSWSLAATAVFSFRNHFKTVVATKQLRSASVIAEEELNDDSVYKELRGSHEAQRVAPDYDTTAASLVYSNETGCDNITDNVSIRIRSENDETSSLPDYMPVVDTRARTAYHSLPAGVPPTGTVQQWSDEEAKEDFGAAANITVATQRSAVEIVLLDMDSTPTAATVSKLGGDLTAGDGAWGGDSLFMNTSLQRQYYASLGGRYTVDEDATFNDPFATLEATCIHLISLLHSVATMYLLRTENYYGKKKAARRRGNPLEIIGGLSLLEKSELNRIGDQCFHVYHWISDYLYSYTSTNKIAPTVNDALPPALVARLVGHLTAGLEAFDAACKIEDTPFPFAYVQVLFWLNICIFLVAPVVVACWMTSIALSVTITVMKVFTFTSIFLAAHQMENPFGYHSSNLPLLQLHSEFTDRILGLLDYQASVKLERMVAHSTIDCRNDTSFQAICGPRRQNPSSVWSPKKKDCKVGHTGGNDLLRRHASLMKFVKGVEEVPLDRK
eukprot:Lankesteria_metandrocarpae@DN2208_c0_g1_i1.p1